MNVLIQPCNIEEARAKVTKLITMKNNLMMAMLILMQTKRKISDATANHHNVGDVALLTSKRRF